MSPIPLSPKNVFADEEFRRKMFSPMKNFAEKCFRR
jgi:hypothetical protein